jgi:putative membrane-bound dehydrogenase-like protein
MLSRYAILVAVFIGCSTAFAQLPPEKALATMKAGDGLQVELFAAEPMLINPTAIDVDHKGRVWVAEAVNYRRKNFNRPMLRAEGDRIQVLIDTNGDGKADEAKTFYQGPEVYGPLSVLVLPQADGKALRVLVAQSPDILEFWDKDGDLKADGPPTKWLSGFGGFDHDHGVHGLTVGPDGKLYFTVGDSGVTGLQSKDGKGKKYVSNTTDVQKGTVWRCDLNGNNLELIAHNFRNNYEACVDSFGEIWLSDNDDDGNQQTRICHVYPGGNYGYGPRGPGQSHWHEEQPGIVHKTLRTGFGSPTGICFYEGKLLPKQYQGDLIHADAGPREIRYFKRKPKGAGYELEKINMLTSSDNWFRPSDVCVAPDGSVFVADWYDPGVGGHGMGDWTRGRIYRLTPKGHKEYKVPAVKLDSKEGLTDAFKSPNIATSNMSRTAIEQLPDVEALKTLADIFLGTKDWAVRARTAWPVYRTQSSLEILNHFAKPLGGPNAIVAYVVENDSYAHAIGEALMERQARSGVSNLASMSGSASAASGRRALIHIRGLEASLALQYFYPLAKLYDGQDIFYRAALNIACGTDPVRRDAILADFEKHFPEWNDKVADLVWELRPKSMLPKMEKLLSDSKLTAAQKARIVDILAVNDGPEAGETMLKLVQGDSSADVKARAIENLMMFLPTKWKGLAKPETIRPVVENLLAADLHTQAMQLAPLSGDALMLNVILNSAKDRPERIPAVADALAKFGTPAAVEKLQIVLMGAGYAKVDPKPVIQAIGRVVATRGNQPAGQEALKLLQSLISPDTDAESVAMMRGVLEALAGSRAGTQWLLNQQEAKKLPTALVADAGKLLRNSPFQGERNKAMMLFPAPGKMNTAKLPAISELVKRKGNAETGKQLMAKSLTNEVQCLKCHMVRGQGGQIGPDLSMIGKKGSRENLFESILYPSKAIADQHVSWKIDTADGQTITGLLVQETETNLTIRDANGKDYSIALKDVEKKSKSLVSLMPEGLIATLTEDELVDLVEYMTTLQTASLTPSSWTVYGPQALKEGENGFALPMPAENPARIKPNVNGYFDLAAFHGQKSPNSVSIMEIRVDSPADQDATILLGTDDGCRLIVNGREVFSHDRSEAAAPERDSVAAKLVKGVNKVTLKINNGNNPHGFYFSLSSAQELKLVK